MDLTAVLRIKRRLEWLAAELDATDDRAMIEQIHAQVLEVAEQTFAVVERLLEQANELGARMDNPRRSAAGVMRSPASPCD